MYVRCLHVMHLTLFLVMFDRSKKLRSLLIVWLRLIDYNLTSNNQYLSCFQNKNKFNPIYKLVLRWVNGGNDNLLQPRIRGEISRDDQSFVPATIRLLVSEINKKTRPQRSKRRNIAFYDLQSGFPYNQPPIKVVPLIRDPRTRWSALWLIALVTFTNSQLMLLYFIVTTYVCFLH